MFWFGQAPSQTSLKQSAQKLGLAIFLAASLGLATGAIAKPDPQVQLGDTTVSLVALPAEAQQTQKLILSGGPFAYQKDGVVFGNRERLLPKHPRGFYREYTVKTPGSKDRGARRIVCGGQQPTQPEVCFYTADHYASFRRIVQ